MAPYETMHYELCKEIKMAQACTLVKLDDMSKIGYAFR
jgi:hypothetical protein